jgi:hypothetical protein
MARTNYKQPQENPTDVVVEPEDFGLCPRCHERHGQLRFKKLTLKAGPFTHWCMCENLIEPILIQVAQRNQKPEEDDDDATEFA